MKLYIVAAFVFASVFANVILVSTVLKLQAMMADLRRKVRNMARWGLGLESLPGIFMFSPVHFERIHIGVVLLVLLVLLAVRERRA